MCFVLQLKTEPGMGGLMDGMNVKSLEERSDGDVASPSSTGTQVHSSTNFIFGVWCKCAGGNLEFVIKLNDSKSSLTDNSSKCF